MATRRLHGPRSRAVREALDISQPVLADRVGVSVSHLSRIEAEIKQPSHTLARRIIEQLCLAVHDQVYPVADDEDTAGAA